MPNPPRKEIKQHIKQYADKFQHLINKPVLIKFGPHDDIQTTLLSVNLLRQADVTNLPDKRLGTEGRYYTPALVGIQCDGLLLSLVLEDIQDTAVTLDGIYISIGNNEITIIGERM